MNHWITLYWSKNSLVIENWDIIRKGIEEHKAFRTMDDRHCESGNFLVRKMALETSLSLGSRLSEGIPETKRPIMLIKIMKIMWFLALRLIYEIYVLCLLYGLEGYLLNNFFNDFSFSLVLVLPINVAVVCLDKFFFVNPFADNTFDGFYKIYGPLETVTPRQSHYGLREIVDRRDL